jgi:hypothetical protein
MLAYAKQKLNEIADDFRYYYVSPCAHESVLFMINTSNIKQLGEIKLHMDMEMILRKLKQIILMILIILLKRNKLAKQFQFALIL